MGPWKSLRIWIASLALLLSAGVADVGAQEQTRAQKKCLITLSSDLRQVWAAQGLDSNACIQKAAQDRLPTVAGHGEPVASAEACLVANHKHYIRAMKKRTGFRFAKKCNGKDRNGSPRMPDFAALPAIVGIEAMTSARLGFLHDIFGPDLDVSVLRNLTDHTGARCQLAVARRSSSCQVEALKEFNRCLRQGLQAPSGDPPLIRSADELQNLCLGAGPDSQPDPYGNIASMCEDKLQRTVNRYCMSGGVDLSLTFPGCAVDDAAATRDCIKMRTDCRLCLALNQAYGLARDCDTFDDGLPNSSCP